METRRLTALDGWRAFSILLVLAAHMLPLGRKSWSLNATAALAGMALFFTLSGFLITSALLKHPVVPSFLVRRFCRIVPLAFLATFLYLGLQRVGAAYYPPHLFFYVNYDTLRLTHFTGHFWSLCVEVHFYLFVALSVLLMGRRGLRILPVLAFAVTANRIRLGVPYSINTHLRCDEILAGAILAFLWFDHERGIRAAVARVLGGIPTWCWILIFALACHERSGLLQYLRPYFAMSIVGSSLFGAAREHRILGSRILRYIAEISYAIYVVHPMSMMGWLGSGDTLQRYLKRPICFLLTWAMAHCSTFYFEHPILARGKKLARHLDNAKLAAREQKLEPVT
jgi:peptidoglycan/LPS O-acetylase OafA/YrhL